MAVNITSTTQLSTFETVRDIFLADSTLSKKFKESNIYQFEPNMKSLSFRSLPYIVINIPNTETELLTMNHEQTQKEFNIEIVLVVAYEPARDKVLEYMNAIIDSLENSESTFDALGYFNLRIDAETPTVELIKEKQVVVSLMTLSFSGGVAR